MSKETSAMATASTPKPQEWFLELVKTIVTVVVIVVGVRSFLFQPFIIPSGSMIPTLLVGDYVFVSKWSYGYSHFSFPFSPDVFSGRIFGSVPDRGDVAVFRKPTEPDVDYIKRIVGLPGDRIQMVDGVLHINGTAVKLERVEDFVDPDDYPVPAHQFIETLPNGVRHPINKMTENGHANYDDTVEITIPDGFVFAMGDNRDNSLDSRVPQRNNGVGLVPLENLVGKAQFRFFSFDTRIPWWHVGEWPFAIRYSRLLTPVR